MKVGPDRYVVLEGDSVSLTCGYDLVSNPQASITWKYPNGSVVTSDGQRIRTVSEESLVQLNISDVRFSDSGSWTCIVEVDLTCVGEPLRENGGSVCSDKEPIGCIQHEIELVVVGKCFHVI